MNRKNKISLVLALLLSAGFPLLAQNPVEEAGETGEIEHAGTEVQVDSALLGRDIFSALPEQVVVRQSAEVRTALNRQVAANADKTISGYRIRIYNASSPRAREESASVIRRFNDRFPYVEADRTYASPFFRVTAGNFRTRLEAEAFLQQVKSDFPDAFIARDRFKYPTLGTPGIDSVKED